MCREGTKRKSSVQKDFFFFFLSNAQYFLKLCSNRSDIVLIRHGVFHCKCADSAQPSFTLSHYSLPHPLTQSSHLNPQEHLGLLTVKGPGLTDFMVMMVSCEVMRIFSVMQGCSHIVLFFMNIQIYLKLYTKNLPVLETLFSLFRKQFVS